MKPSTRKRVIKNFVASLLQSEMTPAELRQLADELIRGSFGPELGRLVRDVSDLADIGDDKADHGRRKSEPEGDQKMLDSVAVRKNAALVIINRRKLSKRAVADLMMLASPWIETHRFPSSASTKEQLDAYFQIASENDVSRFLDILGGEPADAYLKGISSRS